MWIADPKAINHIFQAASHMYEKPPFVREQTALFMDKGLLWASGESESLVSYGVQLLIPSSGDMHKRQRRAMTPAFGPVEAKALYPYFTRSSNSVSNCPTHGWSLVSKLNFSVPR